MVTAGVLDVSVLLKCSLIMMNMYECATQAYDDMDVAYECVE